MARHPTTILDWDLYLPNVVQAINTRKSGRTGFSPLEVLLGYRPRHQSMTPEQQMVQDLV